jgi:O-succinylbenzoate synthase
VIDRDGRRIDVFDLAMNVRFRGVTSRQGVLLSGQAGVGEFSPFVDYDDAESASWLAAAIEAADLPFPEPTRQRVAVNCTVPAVDPEQAAAIVRASNGCMTAKVKVAEPGQGLDDDLARVLAVATALGPGGKVRVDANGAWTPNQAVDAIRVLDEVGLEYVEQPCRTVDELREVRGRVDVPIAADESIRRSGDPYLVKAKDAADIAVLKVQPLGGVRACLRIAEQIGLPVVVSSALETSVGIAAGVALAAALPELPYACGLATTAMLTADVVSDPFAPVDGFLPVTRPAVDAGRVIEAAPSADTRAWWLDRLRRCADLAGGSAR